MYVRRVGAFSSNSFLCNLKELVDDQSKSPFLNKIVIIF